MRPMMSFDTPQSIAAELARRAAERARTYRMRTRTAVTVDAVIVDALAQALADLARGDTVEELVRSIASNAIEGLRQAGVEKPSRAFGQRMKLIEQPDEQAL